MKTKQEPEPITKRNKTYRRVDDTILAYLLTNHHHTTVNDLCKEININRKIFYDHYNDLDDAFNKCQNNLVQSFKEMISSRPAAKNENGNQKLFILLILFFARQKRELVLPLCKNRDNHCILYEIVNVLYPKLYVEWLPIPKNDWRGYVIKRNATEIHKSIIVHLICLWVIAEESNTKQTMPYVNRMLRITEKTRNLQALLR